MMFQPNSSISNRLNLILVGGWILSLIILWELWKPTIFPSPLDVVVAIPGLWSDGLGQEILSSMMVNLEALILAALVGLPLSYLSRVPFLTPVARGVAKLRFLSPAVFFVPLLFLSSGAHEVKVLLLMLANLFFLVTTMNGVVLNIPDFRFDDARTLKMSEWLSVWYVVVRGTATEAIDAVRDNAAMGWSMLMFVEGAVRSEGGIGVILLNSQKYMNYDAVFACAFLILGIGIGQDWILGQLKKMVCPYSQ